MPSDNLRKGWAIASLTMGILSVATFGCLGVGAIVAIVLGIVAVIKAGNAPQEYGGKGLAIGGIACGAVSLVLLPFVGIIAAIAIPSLLRARVSANEAGAIGDTRTVISGQMTYASENGGHFDSLECLAAPASCLPGYQGPVMIDASLLAPDKSGYRRSLHLGSPASEGHRSPSSVTSFAYVAVPIEPGRTGIRGFCGDETGRICVTSDGRVPVVTDGRCGEPCTPLY